MNGEPAINWVGLFVLALLSSVAETCIVAFFLRRLYRESVSDYMRGEGTSRPPEQSDDLPPAAYVELREYYSLPALSPEAEELYRLTTRTPPGAELPRGAATPARALRRRERSLNGSIPRAKKAARRFVQRRAVTTGEPSFFYPPPAFPARPDG
jgi:hypothetical protein